MNGRANGTPVTVRVASAGTGKTTSLVLRYLQLVNDGVALRRVAGVTFTRAAADELRQRVGEALTEVRASGEYLGGLFRAAPGSEERFRVAGHELEGALLTTIHGFMIAGLRHNAPRMGLDPGFAILAEWEAQALFEVELASLLLLAEEPGHGLHHAAAFLGSEAVPKAVKLFQKRSLAERFTFGADPESAALSQLYRAALAAFDARMGAASLAPSEVERRALQMLAVPAARQRLAARYPRVLVDEYQDVNPLQGRFFEKLGQVGVSLELVGDPKQSIYGFRNADVSVFRRAMERAAEGGGVLPPLSESRRHSRAVLGFLNRLTDHLAEGGKGFQPSEAPAVAAAGAQAEALGSVELHVVSDERSLPELRQREAELLGERLKAQHEAGTPYDHMAVLARTYTGLALVQRVLTAQGVPNVLGQGRGYYERTEVRDAFHALSVGVDPAGPSLAPFLRGPFAALELAEVAEVLRRPEAERVAYVEERFPGVAERMRWLASVAAAPPLEAMKRLVRERASGGRSFLEMLGRRERENVDALLFEVADHPPADLTLLLDRLQLLARQGDAGDVPQVGSGVRLLTVHASKGLEFPVTAVFDAGGWPNDRVEPVLVDPASGTVSLMGEPGFREAAAAARRRRREESFRLLYVAVSRARDHLVITGSEGYGRAVGWLAELTRLGLVGERALEGVSLQRHPYQEPAPAPRLVRSPAAPLVAAPYTAQRLSGSPLPPVSSPSRLSAADEPLPAALLASAEREIERGRVGWGRARGTLVHYAIGQDWSPDDAATLSTLRSQEVLFPFSAQQREELLGEVVALLGDYQALLGTALPPLNARSVDRAELPLVVRRGELVWEGIVDRLYQVDGEWLVDDYKTDVQVVPERYFVQLGLYLEALEGALGTRPRGRLVFLKGRQVVEPERAELERAVSEALRLGQALGD